MYKAKDLLDLLRSGGDKALNFINNLIGVGDLKMYTYSSGYGLGEVVLFTDIRFSPPEESEGTIQSVTFKPYNETILISYIVTDSKGVNVYIEESQIIGLANA